MPSLAMVSLVLITLVVSTTASMGGGSTPLVLTGADSRIRFEVFTKDLDTDDWMGQTGCKIRQTTSVKNICGRDADGSGFDRMASMIGAGTYLSSLWRVNCTNMETQRNGKNGTFAMSIGQPSFKTNAFSCGRKQYMVWCKPSSNTHGCEQQWDDVSSGMVKETDGEKEIYLIAGQMVDISCDFMLGDLPADAWQSPQSKEFELSIKIQAAFLEGNEKILFQPAMSSDQSLKKVLHSSVTLEMLEGADPLLCDKEYRREFQWNVDKFSRASNSINSAQVKFSRASNSRISYSGCPDCIAEEITQPLGQAALQQIGAQITAVIVDPKQTAVNPELLRQSAFLGPPRLDDSENFFYILRDIIIDPARLPAGTQHADVTLKLANGGQESTVRRISIAGATGEGILQCPDCSSDCSSKAPWIAVVIVLCLAVMALLGILYRKAQNPRRSQEAIELS